MTTLNAIAPYPATEEQVTAENFSLYLAARAFVRDRRITAPGDGMSKLELRECEAQMAAFNAEFAVVSLLRDLAGHDQTLADVVARKVWLSWQDGGVMPELLWEWLVGWGIDARQLGALTADVHSQQGSRQS